MEYTRNRIERPPGMTTKCLLVEGTIQLAGYDADLNIVFPGGQKAVLQSGERTVEATRPQPTAIGLRINAGQKSTKRAIIHASSIPVEGGPNNVKN